MVPMPERPDVVEHPRRQARARRCGSPATCRSPATATAPQPAVRQRRLALVGRLGGLRRRTRRRRARCARARSSGSTGRLPARGHQRAWRSPASTRAGGSGLGGLHTLFAREHNLLCDELRAHYRGWSDERVYQTARLIVSALIAKIHTVEWTPAILGTEAIDLGLKANWNGPPANDWLTRLGIWLIDSHCRVSASRKTMPDHHGSAVLADRGLRHRLPAAPADPRRLPLRRPPRRRAARHAAASSTSRAPTPTTSCAALGLENVLYSFGIAHPGAITLHNFPRVAAASSSATASVIDLSVVDLVRTRRRGVPRYNDFRAGPAQAAAPRLGGAVRRPGDRTPAARGLPQHRRGRHDGRPVRRDAAGRASASPTPRSGSSS